MLYSRRTKQIQDLIKLEWQRIRFKIIIGNIDSVADWKIDDALEYFRWGCCQGLKIWKRTEKNQKRLTK